MLQNNKNKIVVAAAFAAGFHVGRYYQVNVTIRRVK